jgi:hypothetical protein
MAKRPRKKKRSDHQQLARKVLDAIAPDASEPTKNPAAVALGRLGGLVGGKARAEKLSKKRRSEIAANAAAQRWAQERRKSDGISRTQ